MTKIDEVERRRTIVVRWVAGVVTVVVAVAVSWFVEGPKGILSADRVQRGSSTDGSMPVASDSEGPDASVRKPAGGDVALSIVNASNGQPLVETSVTVGGHDCVTDELGRVSALPARRLLVECRGFLSDRVDASSGDAQEVELLPDIFAARLELVPRGQVEEVDLSVVPSMLDPGFLSRSLVGVERALVVPYRERASELWRSMRRWVGPEQRADAFSPLLVDAPVAGEYKVVASWRGSVIAEAVVTVSSGEFKRVPLAIDPPAVLRLRAMCDGAPVPEAGFSVWSHDQSWKWAGIADDSGWATVCARPDDVLQVSWFGDSLMSARTRIRVGSPGTVSAHVIEVGRDAQIPAAAELRGRVFDEVSGSAVVGAEVIGDQSCFSDTDGRFVVTSFAPWEWNEAPFILVKAKGYKSRRVGVPEGSSFDIGLRPIHGDDAFLRVDLLNEAGGLGADEMRLKLVAECVGRDRCEITIPDSELRRQGVGFGDGRVGFHATDGESVEYALEIRTDRGHRVGWLSGRLFKGDDVVRTLDLSAKRDVTGRVTGDGVSDVSSLSVVALRWRGVRLEPIARASADGEGGFTFRDLPPGDLCLIAHGPLCGAFLSIGPQATDERSVEDYASDVTLRLTRLRSVALPWEEAKNGLVDVQPVGDWPWRSAGVGRGVVGPEGSMVPVLVEDESGRSLRFVEPGQTLIR